MYYSTQETQYIKFDTLQIKSSDYSLDDNKQSLEFHLFYQMFFHSTKKQDLLKEHKIVQPTIQ